mmetsp:Transcript_50563/g.157939  ORF Transcript_50563/g.157939 Transcript_50563/m.157939 type:complete len:150 (-) Transcript_50563:321-770(-)
MACQVRNTIRRYSTMKKQAIDDVTLSRSTSDETVCPSPIITDRPHDNHDQPEQHKQPPVVTRARQRLQLESRSSSEINLSHVDTSLLAMNGPEDKKTHKIVVDQIDHFLNKEIPKNLIRKEIEEIRSDLTELKDLLQYQSKNASLGIES